jgi:hypothetical protein
MKLQTHHQLWIILFVAILISLFACNTKKEKGTIYIIERETLQELPESSKNEKKVYGPFVPKANDFRVAPLTGFVIVLLEDGTKIRCKNPFPDLTTGQKVKVKETNSGDWVITK